ncbi:hypothetical protein ACROYT_G021839 [Oculina patagonica]
MLTERGGWFASSAVNIGGPVFAAAKAEVEMGEVRKCTAGLLRDGDDWPVGLFLSSFSHIVDDAEWQNFLFILDVAAKCK